MSLYVADLEKGLLPAIEQLKDVERVRRMKAAQREFIASDAAEKTVDFMEKNAKPALIYTFFLDTAHERTIR